MVKFGNSGGKKIKYPALPFFPVTAVSFAIVGIVQLYCDPILGPHLEQVSNLSVDIVTGGPDSTYDHSIKMAAAIL